MRLPKTHTFAGRKYHIIIGEKLDGFSDTDDKYWIVVERDIKKLVGFETLIHESLHACDWSADEEKVTQTAHDLARLLWNVGYRLR